MGRIISFVKWSRVIKFEFRQETVSLRPSHTDKINRTTNTWVGDLSTTDLNSGPRMNGWHTGFFTMTGKTRSQQSEYFVPLIIIDVVPHNILNHSITNISQTTSRPVRRSEVSYNVLRVNVRKGVLGKRCVVSFTWKFWLLGKYGGPTNFMRPLTGTVP